MLAAKNLISSGIALAGSGLEAEEEREEEAMAVQGAQASWEAAKEVSHALASDFTDGSGLLYSAATAATTCSGGTPPEAMWGGREGGGGSWGRGGSVILYCTVMCLPYRIVFFLLLSVPCPCALPSSVPVEAFSFLSFLSSGSYLGSFVWVMWDLAWVEQSWRWRIGSASVSGRVLGALGWR